MNDEASGAWSFSVIDAVRRTNARVRIALVRGENDRFRKHDSAFVVAGGTRLHRTEIPFASHALTTMLLAAPVISHAMRFLSDTTLH